MQQIIIDSYNDYISIDEKYKEVYAEQIVRTAKGFIKNCNSKLQDWLDAFTDQRIVFNKLKMLEKFEWVCNECNFPNFTSSVSEDEIDQELHACINCGGFEFHKRIIKLS